MKWVALIFIFLSVSYAAIASEAWLTPEVPLIQVITTISVLPEHNPQPIYPCGTP